jgi:hypothetical protein
MWKVSHPFGDAYDASPHSKIPFHHVVGSIVCSFFVDVVHVSYPLKHYSLILLIVDILILVLIFLIFDFLS